MVCVGKDFSSLHTPEGEFVFTLYSDPKILGPYSVRLFGSEYRTNMVQEFWDPNIG